MTFMCRMNITCTRKSLTSCSKSADKPWTNWKKLWKKLCVRTACLKLSTTIWNKLWTTCTVYNNLVDIIRLVARLFQQVRYSNDTRQYCYNLVSSTLQRSCYIMTVSDLLEPCNKSNNVIKLVTSCLQHVPNLLQQLGTSSAKHNLSTACEQISNNLFCLQTCNNLYIFTCVWETQLINILDVNFRHLGLHFFDASSHSRNMELAVTGLIFPILTSCMVHLLQYSEKQR